MPKIKTTSWVCMLCGDSVSEIGAYAKLALGKYAHVTCLVNKLHAEGIALGRKEILDEQKAAKEHEIKETAARHLAEYSNLPRCQRCGRKMGEARFDWPGEVVAASGTPNVCALCVRDEVQARARARQPQAPANAAEAIRQAPSAPVRAAEQAQTTPCAQCKQRFAPPGETMCDECKKKPQDTRRFELLDMD